MPITYHEQKKLFSLAGENTEYIFALDYAGLIKHLYWGDKTSCLDDFDAGFTFEISSNDPSTELTPEEYSPWGGLRYKEPCIKTAFADGTRDLALVYKGHEISGAVVKINLADAHYPLSVTLCYRLIEDLDIIERWAEIANGGQEPVTLQSVASAEFNFKEEDLWQSNVFGHWISEQKMFRERLTPGKKVLESRRGGTGHNHSPYFILDNGADEDHGRVYFGVLAHTGNFKVTFEKTQYRTTRVVIGINDFDFSWQLKKKETFRTPSVFCGCTDKGFGDMSRRLSILALTSIMPENHRGAVRPVLYNSWEATLFNVTCQGQMELAEKAAGLGVELFVIDDGWFGQRHSDKAGLGDWYVNREKFPDGLKTLIEKVNGLAMDFGIWVELEMVNPDSDLYRKHPDWIYNFNNRTPSTSRNQLALNLCNPEVVAYLKGVMVSLLSDNNIAYVKWDVNRPISEPGALNLPIDDQESIWYRHTLAFYDIIETLRAQFPHVAFEACASGGGRIDYGCLMRFDQFWTSDNTDALDRLAIQEGYSYMFPAKAMRAWVTDCPNFIDKRSIPLRYRFHCAMMGSLGIGGNLNKWTGAEMEEAKAFVAQYKEIRNVVQEGLIYRISSIREGHAAVQYVLGGESVLFVFTRGEQFGRELFTITLKGLDPARRYTALIDGFPVEKSGDYFMKAGITLHLPGDYASKLVRITAKT